MKYVGKVCGTLPGEVNLKVTKSKKVNILLLMKDRVDGNKAEDSRLMRTVIIE